MPIFTVSIVSNSYCFFFFCLFVFYMYVLYLTIKTIKLKKIINDLKITLISIFMRPYLKAGAILKINQNFFQLMMKANWET